MVFFTCDSCGASLKKNQVEKHYLHQCRSCTMLTCIDCQKDFPGDTYKEHTKCISEEEKYSAKGWQPKASANKGLKKQEAWLDNIRAIQDERGSSLDSDVRKLLDTIIGFDNIPRKRQKFVNFIQNALGRRTQTSTIDKTWEIFEEAIKRNIPAKPDPAAAVEAKAEKSVDVSADDATDSADGISNKKKSKKDKKSKKSKKKEESDENVEKDDTADTTDVTADSNDVTGVNDDDATPMEEEEVMNQGVKMFPGTKAILNGNKNSNVAKGDKKKRKREQGTMDLDDVTETQVSKTAVMDVEERDESEGDENNPKKFNWEFTVRKLLKKKGDMKVKRLKKKIVDEYVKRHGDTVKSRIQLEAKLEKKLKKNKEFKYTKDTVSLATSRE